MIDDPAAVAIVGVAIRLDDAPDRESFWARLLHGAAATSGTEHRVEPHDAVDAEEACADLAAAALRDAVVSPSRDVAVRVTAAGVARGAMSPDMAVGVTGGGARTNGEHDFLASLRWSLEALAAGREDRVVCGVVEGEHGAALVLCRGADARADGERIYAFVGTDAPIDPPGLVCLAGSEQRLMAPAGQREPAPLPTTAVGRIARRWGIGPPLADAVELVGACLAVEQAVLPPTSDAVADVEVDPERYHAVAAPRPWLGGGTGRTAEVRLGNDPDALRVTLRQAPAAPEGFRELDRRWPAELFLLAADDRSGLVVAAERLRHHARNYPSVPLCDLAATLAQEPARRFRLAVVAADREDLAAKLDAADPLLRDGSVRDAQRRSGIWFGDTAARSGDRTAFVFPGNGSQYAGMLADLCRRFPAARDWFEGLDEAWRGDPSEAPTRLVFPSSRETEAQRQRVQQALASYERGLQANFLASMALHELLTAAGLRPDAVVGYSSGENAALIASSVLQFEDRHALFDLMEVLRLDDAGDDAGERVPQGVALAVTGSRREDVDEVVAARAGELFVTLDNCPGQVALFGTAGATAEAADELRARGGIVLTLPFDRAYHTPWCERHALVLRRIYKGIEVRAPAYPVYSCVTAAPFPQAPDQIRDLAAGLWARPVRFRQTIERMWEAGIRNFVEVGAGGRLKGFIDDTLRGRPHLAVATDVENRPGDVELLRALGALFARGLDVDPAPLFRHRDPRPVRLPWHARRPSRSDERALSSPAFSVRRRCAQPALDSRVATASRAGADVGEAGRAHAAPLDEAARARVLAEQMELLEEFMRQQARAWELFFGGESRALGAADQTAGTEVQIPAAGRAGERGARGRGRAGPMLGDVIEHGGDRALCRRTLSLATDPYLSDHTLGHRGVPGSPAAGGLAILPFSFSLEIIAEAAALLGSDAGIPVRMDDVRQHRWIALDADAVTLEIEAVLAAAPDGVAGSDRAGLAVRVRIHEVVAGADPGADGGPGGAVRHLCVEGTVVLAPRYPSPPPPLILDVDDEREPLWQPQAYYDECLFHGPALSCMRRVVACGDGAIEVEVEAPAEVAPLSTARDAVVLPAVLLDGLGQLSSYEPVEAGAAHFAMFPFALERLRWFRRPPRPGERWSARVETVRRDADVVTTRCDFIAADGVLAVRAEGFRSTFHPMPQVFLSLLVRPGPETLLSAPVTPTAPACIARAIDVADAGWLHTAGGIWLRALAHLFLDAEERRHGYAPPAITPDRISFLLGRIVTIEAMLAQVWEREGRYLRPGDVEFLETTGGGTRVRARAGDGFVLERSVSIAARDGRILATVATTADARAGAGLARIAAAGEPRPLDPPLSAGETAALERVDGTRQAALRSALDAAAGALGVPLDGAPRPWRVTGGTARFLQLRVGDVALTVYLDVDDSWAAATCVASRDTVVRARSGAERDISSREGRS